MFLASLAGADFSVGMMSPFFNYLVGVPSGIRLSQSVRSVCLFSLCGALLSTLCSVFSLLAIAVDRFIAITMPLRYDDLMTLRKAKMAIAVTWSVAFSLTIPPSLGRNRWSGDSRCSLTEVLHVELRPCTVRSPCRYLPMRVDSPILHRVRHCLEATPPDTGK